MEIRQKKKPRRNKMELEKVKKAKELLKQVISPEDVLEAKKTIALEEARQKQYVDEMQNKVRVSKQREIQERFPKKQSETYIICNECGKKITNLEVAPYRGGKVRDVAFLLFGVCKKCDSFNMSILQQKWPQSELFQRINNPLLIEKLLQ
jgi:hypothetical protein